MLILKNGGSALDAVEIAIKTLEDREITNAGYGSNLAMDGVVECDASIVDHYGRSGAVGAVARKSSEMKTCCSLLTILDRNQEPHISSTYGSRPYHGSAYTAPSPSKPSSLPGRYRFRHRNGHANSAARCTNLTSCQRPLDAMALGFEIRRTKIEEEQHTPVMLEDQGETRIRR